MQLVHPKVAQLKLEFFSLRTVIEHWSSSPDARQYTEKPLREAQLLIELAFDICLCLPLDRTWHKFNDPKVDYSGGLREGKVGHEPRLEPSDLCWSSANLVECGPDEPSWT